MNIKVLTLLALLISTIYIYYTVQRDKDRIYQTLYQEKSNQIPKSVMPKTPIKKEVVIVEEAPIKSFVKKLEEKKVKKLEEKKVEKKIEKKVEKKVSISKENILRQEDVKKEEDLESAIALALKGITTLQIIKTEEK